MNVILRDIYRYTGLLYATNLVASAVTFFVTVWITREISKEAVGTYALFQTYFFAAGYFSGLGFGHPVVKYIAERRIELRQLHTFLAGFLVLMTLVTVPAGLILKGTGHEVLGLALLTLPAYQVFNLALAYARGHQWRGGEASILFFGSIATSTFVLLLLRVFPNQYGPIYGQIASVYLSAVVLLTLFAWRHGGMRAAFARPRGGWWLGFVGLAVPVFVTASLSSTGEFLDRMFVEHYQGRAVLAEFYLAGSFFNILDKPVMFLARGLLPNFCKSAAAAGGRIDMDALSRILKLNLVILPVFSLLVVGLLPLVARTFFNKDYSAAFGILAVLSIVIVIKAFEVINSMLGIARNNAKNNMVSEAVGLFVYIPLAIVLVNTVGVLGVALAVVVRWLVMITVQFSRMAKSGIETVSRATLVRALAAYLSALALFLPAPWLMVPAYLAVGGLLKLWTPHDFSLVRRSLRWARAQGK